MSQVVQQDALIVEEVPERMCSLFRKKRSKSLLTKSVSKLIPIPEEIKTLAFLAKETVIEGKMTFEGEFLFDGKFEGEMFGGGH